MSEFDDLVEIRNSATDEVEIRLTIGSNTAITSIGGGQAFGQLHLKNPGQNRGEIRMSSHDATVNIGGDETDGTLVLLDNEGNHRLLLHGDTASLTLWDKNERTRFRVSSDSGQLILVDDNGNYHICIAFPMMARKRYV